MNVSVFIVTLNVAVKPIILSLIMPSVAYDKYRKSIMLSVVYAVLQFSLLCWVLNMQKFAISFTMPSAVYAIKHVMLGHIYSKFRK